MKWRGVEGGTPTHGKHLCKSCDRAHIMRGEAASEQIIYCEAMYYRPIRVPFSVVTECSSYEETGRPSLYDMKKMAYLIKTDPRGKPVGFMTNNDFRKESGLDRDDDIITPSLPWNKRDL